MRQLIAREQQYKANRKRTNSEATEVPLLSDTPIETFSHEVEVGGVLFNTVKLFHPRTGECAFSSFCCEADFV
jgi:translation initiation factor 2-alpha kinase 4